jgi:Skp family chaperone for outer membrane proteins
MAIESDVPAIAEAEAAEAEARGEEFGEPKYDIAYWKDQIALALKELRKFHERGRKTQRRYLDEREAGEEQNRKYNLFWANTGVLRSALYANPPKPTVKRQWDDYNDDIGRVAAEILERLLLLGLQRPRGDMDIAFGYATEDRLVPGLGQVWLRYDVKTKTETVPGTSIEYERIVDENAITDYLHWEDFLWAPCRVWEECRWIARRAHMTKEMSTKRFGKNIAENLTYSDRFEPTKDNVGGEDSTPRRRPEATAEIWEIWNKPNEMVYWVATSDSEMVLDKKADPLELEGFFPCPKPLTATNSTSNLTPRPDYYMTKDQYEEIDIVNTRINWLIKACKAAGVYDKNSEGIQRLFDQGVENTLIPVDNWAMFAERGGIQGQIDWIPLEQIVGTIDTLSKFRSELVSQLYELTGISDIMRGSTNARETLGAQQLKAQYGSVRLQYIQGTIAEFVQEAMRIKADIISKHFQPETMIKKSLIEMIPPADHDKIGPAVKMIQNTPVAAYHLEVEADDMSIPDYTIERQSRIEYTTAVGQLLSQSYQAIEAEPRFAPLVLQILQWTAAGFKNGRMLEGVLDQAVEQTLRELQEKAKQPPPPSPEVIEAQANAQAKQAETQQEIQRDAQKTQAEIKQGWAKTQAEIQQDNADAANERRLSWLQGRTDATIARMKEEAMD